MTDDPKFQSLQQREKELLLTSVRARMTKKMLAQKSGPARFYSPLVVELGLKLVRWGTRAQNRADELQPQTIDEIPDPDSSLPADPFI